MHLAISSVVTRLLETNRFASADNNDAASTIDGSIISIELRLGGVHPEVDPSTADGCAVGTIDAIAARA